MVIRFYGTRGSIPVSGPTTIEYGGNTTCLYIETKSGQSIIIDAGSGIRELGIYLMQNQKYNLHLIFTHYHWDHIQGFPFFAPVYSKNTAINIYGPENEVGAQKALSYQMHVPFFPTIKLTDLPARLAFKRVKNRFKIGNVAVQVIQNNHPNYTFGLRFSEDKKSAVFLTDNELYAPKPRTPYKKFVKFIQGADLLIHDAQYVDENYPNRIGWGHSTFNQVMQLAVEGGVKKVIFTHHDPSSSDEFINNILIKLRKQFPDYDLDAARTGTEIKL
ncbi:MAG: MBL fold metallo-hydrolase [candidate division WOR-3 bacterium]